MDSLTHEYRAQNALLRSQTLRDLQRLWPALSYTNLDGTYPLWFAGAATLVTRDGRRAAGLASLYVKRVRSKAGITGAAPIRLAANPPTKVETALRVTSIVAIKRSALAGKAPEIAMADAFTQSSGAAVRLILDAGRDTVRNSVLADPQAAGWQRVTSGGCDFCQMLADRGEVYTEATADFESHDHCACSAEPVYT